jgi:hypothetical protein
MIRQYRSGLIRLLLGNDNTKEEINKRFANTTFLSLLDFLSTITRHTLSLPTTPYTRQALLTGACDHPKCTFTATKLNRLVVHSSSYLI